MTAPGHQELLGPLLRDVSRSFYLTLKILPAAIRPQISVAYLLARASDTIADTAAVASGKRIECLRRMRDDDLSGLAGVQSGQASPAEATLLRRLPECLALRDSFSAPDRDLIRQVHHTIIEGQMFDLERFAAGTATAPVALADDAELDRYTYLVAGCVGEFWTRVCAAHVPALAGWKDETPEAQGVRFGQGLQLVNILRDMPRDLRNGRCYLPVADPARLLEPARFDEIREVYDRWLETAIGYLETGWDYTLMIPASEPRLRLACIWPIWIGLKTIARLRQANPLDPACRVKVTRGEVYRLMARSWLARRNDAALGRGYERLREQARRSGSG